MIKQLICLGCSDSRHVGFPNDEVLEKLERPTVHVISNAGADAKSGDLARLIQKLVDEKKVRSRKEILVVATAHVDPECGGAHVDDETIKTLKTDLKKLEFNLDSYLDSYNYGEKEVFSSVPSNPVHRAANQADALKLYGTSYVTGLYSLHESHYQPLFASDEELKEIFYNKITGKTFENDKELLKHQKPSVLLLSVVGRHARLQDAHKIPGEAFHVSVNSEKPTTKTVLSLIYYVHLKPKNARVQLVGDEKELKELSKFVKRDELLNHMIEKGRWSVAEKLA